MKTLHTDLPGMGPLWAENLKGPGIEIDLNQSWSEFAPTFYARGVPSLSDNELPTERKLKFPEGKCYSDGMGLTQVLCDSSEQRRFLLPNRVIEQVHQLTNDTKKLEDR
jgi:hypothetical protein